MSLFSTFRVGRVTCHTIDAGRQRLDGGAMFGVVPKPLWERRIPADERNRIPLALRCLLIEHDDGLVLVDTGVGNKESAKFHDIYGIENRGQHGPTQLEDALHATGHAVEDVRFVVNTHLHFDHAGGNTFVDREGAEPRITFPRATYVVQQRELDFAGKLNERTAASYLLPNFAPIAAASRWRLIQGDCELVPGIRLVPTPGHVPGHQSVLLHSDGESALFLGDLVPTSAHLPLPWIMGYDLEPLVTLESKRRWLTQAESEGWLVVFEHDPAHGVGRVIRDGKSFSLGALDTP